MKKQSRWNVGPEDCAGALASLNEICDGDRNAKLGFFFEVPISDMIEIYEQIRRQSDL